MSLLLHSEECTVCTRYRYTPVVNASSTQTTHDTIQLVATFNTCAHLKIVSLHYCRVISPAKIVQHTITSSHPRVLQSNSCSQTQTTFTTLAYALQYMPWLLLTTILKSSISSSGLSPVADLRSHQRLLTPGVGHDRCMRGVSWFTLD